MNAPLYSTSPNERNNENNADSEFDTWRPVGLGLRRAAREFGLPIATAIAVFEANGFRVEAD